MAGDPCVPIRYRNKRVKSNSEHNVLGFVVVRQRFEAGKDNDTFFFSFSSLNVLHINTARYQSTSLPLHSSKKKKKGIQSGYSECYAISYQEQTCSDYTKKIKNAPRDSLFFIVAPAFPQPVVPVMVCSLIQSLIISLSRHIT